MVNGTQWGFALTFLWSLQALIPSFALTTAELEGRDQLNDLSQLRSRIQGLGLTLPGGVKYEMREPLHTKTAQEAHDEDQTPEESYKYQPVERKSFAMELQEKLKELKAYTGKDFDPIRVNIRATKMRPSMLIENLHNDDKTRNVIFSAFQALEVDKDEITLKFYYTF